MKTYYIAGGMSGLPDHNFPMFYEVESVIERLGHMAVNPARLDDDDGLPVGVPSDEGSWDTAQYKQRFLLRDFKAIMAECAGLVLLPGWQKSVGANCELALARMTGLEVLEAYQTRDDTTWGIPWLFQMTDVLPDVKMISQYMKDGLGTEQE